ncbi:hypothetical protein BTUL_0109g00040 [Botrytis tulipae]|uniref:Acyl-CoA thioesterase-like C-terminal domain-containing protein n=1 Tax=Botrytis tulipae TaxID=87230 RepID=A0A4Z1EIZ8_9HELO|nr:hypothetical protein BTUL_0109g00040 [Botrytis tulipae]
MAQTTIETPASLPDVLAQNIKFIKKKENTSSIYPAHSVSVHESLEVYEYNQPDALSMQWQFFRLLFASIATLSIKDIHLGKSSSTILVTISQKGKECMMGFMNLRDQWLTPTDPSTRFTNETLSFLLDISFPILDNFYPEKASGGQAATVQAGLAQKREQEMGVTKIVDAESGSYRAPAMITSLATSIEIKKLLPPGGTKWLFMRAQAKEIKDGRLSMEVMVFDEGMELVALSQQLCPIIELSRAMANKQKL